MRCRPRSTPDADVRYDRRHLINVQAVVVSVIRCRLHPLIFLPASMLWLVSATFPEAFVLCDLRVQGVRLYSEERP